MSRRDRLPFVGLSEREFLPLELSAGEMSSGSSAADYWLFCHVVMARSGIPAIDWPCRAVVVLQAASGVRRRVPVDVVRVGQAKSLVEVVESFRVGFRDFVVGDRAQVPSWAVEPVGAESPLSNTGLLSQNETLRGRR